MRFDAIIWISLAVVTIFGTIVHAAAINPDGFYIGDTFVHNAKYPAASKNFVIVYYNAGVGPSGQRLIRKLLHSMFHQKLEGVEPDWTESRITALEIEFSDAVPINGGVCIFPKQSGKISFSVSGDFGNCYNRGCEGMVDNAGEGRITFKNNREVFYSSPHNKFTDKI
ncbi:hypothetical protein F5876DRAFT_66693 [Lentinula aff. lateritia]|uniref:Uncharacterized protein n=1 Tax=Lentinula aff. lateritia TaxID=2804960 RepID=A0ACC1TX84_9AGAR|nr:hypothetical protein F5876DRAFT_66693 [Lentinula aff. lateritia]